MNKDPNSRLPFSVDWSAWLAAEGDTADTTTWIVPAGITQETFPAPTLVDGKATIWLSGGTVGQSYEVTCRMATTGGRVDDYTMRVQVRDR